MFTTYSLHSQKLNKYYVGYTSLEIKDRLRRHLSNHHYFTGQTDDWEIIFTKYFADKLESIALEKRIKKRGAVRFLRDLDRGE